MLDIAGLAGPFADLHPPSMLTAGAVLGLLSLPQRYRHGAASAPAH